MNDGQTKHGEQAEALYKLCAQQLAEHKTWLKQQIQSCLAAQDPPGALLSQRGFLAYSALAAMVDEITFIRAAPEKVVHQESADGEARQTQTEISITYDYPDALVTWLQKNLPEALAGASFVKPRQTSRLPSNR